MVGLPLFYNLAFVPTEIAGSMDAEMLIALKPRYHPSVEYMRQIRAALTHDFPGSKIWFQPADIVT